MKRTILSFVGGGLGYLLVVPVLLAGLPFWLVALLTRTLQAWIEPRTVSWNELIRFDPVVGWRPKPCLRAYCRAVQTDVWHVKTDEEGWCGPASLDESPLVVFGDSFAFGYAVNRPFFRASRSGLRIKAIGAPGYSTVQELMLMAELAPRLREKLVVWLIYPGNDLTDNLSPAMRGYRAPFLRESSEGQGWDIVSSHLQPDKWAAQPRFDKSKKVSTVFGNNPASDRAYAACEFLIARGQAVCKQARANLVVFVIPWMIQYERCPWQENHAKALQSDLPERRLGEICNKLGVEFVAGRQHFTLGHYIPEGHLSEKGHRHLSKVLHDLYRKHRSPVPDIRWSRSVPIVEEA